MNIRTTLNHITLASCCLLFVSTQALADRPAMSERPASSEPEMIDISTDLEEVPVFEELPAQETAPQAEAIPATEESSALETLPGMEGTPAVEVEMPPQEQPSDELEPVIHVYDHRTETKVTGDVIELQPGDTLPIRILDFPRRGMTMEKVRNELGEPLTMSAAIGTPPITSWTYNDRIVYFEYSSVVHVVATP